MSRWSWLVFLFGWCGAPHVLCAQADGAPESEARALFSEADRAIDEGRFAEARDLLTRSLEARPHPATAFNLGVALRGTGQLHRAVEVFDAILGGRYGAIRDEQRREVETLRASVRGDFASITVAACDDSGALESPLTTFLDGQRQADLSACTLEELSVDPGEHVLRIEAPGFEPVEASFAVPAAGRHEVRAVLVALPATIPAGDDTALWVALAVGGALLIGGAVTVGVVATQPAPHVVDPVFGEVVALRF